MTSAYDTKAVLLDLMKQGDNKTCVDCNTPMPQWCSLSFGVFVCLTCSGAHRGLGTHISFVRSLTMDKWTDSQISKMKLGGNAKAKAFFSESPEYTKNMTIQEKYTSHFASQYKDKLAAEVEGREWTPSAAPPPTSESTVRKPQARVLGSAGNRSASSSSSLRSSTPTGNVSSQLSQKVANEAYFANMGAANDARPEHLPPSQGGKYGGFGSDPSYNPSANKPFGTSSRALPGVDDIRDDPLGALSRGWGVLGSALGQASQTIQTTVVQPTMERATDPNLQSQFSNYLGTASSYLSETAKKAKSGLETGFHSGSEVVKRETGYDVESLSQGLWERAFGRAGTNQSVESGGYARVGDERNVPSIDPREMTGDSFFGSYLDESAPTTKPVKSNTIPSKSTTPQLSRAPSTQPPRPPSAQPQESAPVPVLPGEDAWAKLAPVSSARRAATPVVKEKEKETKKTEWGDFEDW